MKQLHEYDTPETHAAPSLILPLMCEDPLILYSPIKKWVDAEISRDLERRLAACREALEEVAEMHRAEATGDPDRQPTDEGRKRHAEMIIETLTLTKP